MRGMSGVKSSRLQLRKPASPAAEEPADSAPRRSSGAPSEGEALTAHAVRAWRSRALQLERATALALGDVQRSELLVNDALAVVDGVRAHARSIAEGGSAEKLVEYAESALRRFDAKHRERAETLSLSPDLPFEPNAGNTFLRSTSDDAGPDSWSSGDRLTISGLTRGENALLDGARIAALEAKLVELAPVLEKLSYRLERIMQTEVLDSTEPHGTGDLLRATLPLLRSTARELNDLAQVTPGRGFLMGGNVADARSARKAPPTRSKLGGSQPSPAPRTPGSRHLSPS